MRGERGDRPHSAEFFGPERDHWWNLDQLALIACRIGLGDVASALDVGCGVGHWGRLLGSVLPAEAQIVGVDREPSWVREASAPAERARLSQRLRYVEGRAEALPFHDASFDLVTCQTVLIHVESPPAVIGEMLRVAKPGGVILAAEPNNRTSALVATSNTAAASIDELLDEAWFLLMCERGKVALGEGDNSVGDLVPGYLAEQGVREVETFIADKRRRSCHPTRPGPSRRCATTCYARPSGAPWGGCARTPVASSSRAAAAPPTSTGPGTDVCRPAGAMRRRCATVPSTPPEARSCTSSPGASPVRSCLR